MGRSNVLCGSITQIVRRRCLPAGNSSWPYCSVNWEPRIHCGRFVAGSRRPWANWCTWACETPQRGRPWHLYQTVFHDLPDQCQALAATKQRRFRCKHRLRSLNATVIELCAPVFDWAWFQGTKGTIKLHLQLDHQGCQGRPPGKRGQRHIDEESSFRWSSFPGRVTCTTLVCSSSYRWPTFWVLNRFERVWTAGRFPEEVQLS